MSRAWRAWVELWDRREPATAQALVRIGVGLCMLFDLLQVRWLGLVEAVWAPPPVGMAYGGGDAVWAARWFGASAESAGLLWWIAVVAIAAFTVGALTRVAGLTFVLIYAQMAHLAPDCDRGIDIAIRAVVAILALSSCHARWSVDAWIRRRLGRPFPELVPAWPRLLLFAQLIWIYFSGGHNKGGPEWGPFGQFAALANVLSDPHFSRFSADWVSALYPLTQLATASVMAFEYGAPLMIPLTWFHATADRPGRLRRLCNRLRLRWIWIGVGVGFHIGIAATLRLGIFPWGMLAIYPVLLHPGELVAAEAWLRRRAGAWLTPSPRSTSARSRT